MASQRKVSDIIQSAVLPGDHVFNVMGQFAISLVKAAVFAPLASPLTDEPADTSFHGY
jgi:hypothetical protein